MIDPGVPSFAHADEVKQFGSASGGTVFWNAVVAGVNGQVPQDAQIRIEVVLLRNHANERTDFTSLRPDVAAFYGEFTDAERSATGDHAHRRGLTRAVRPE